METLYNWGNLKDKGNIMFSFIAAYLAEQNYKAYKDFHKNSAMKGRISLSVSKKWLEYYRGRKKLEKEVLDSFEETFLEDLALHQLIFVILRFISRRPDDKILELMEIIPFIDNDDRRPLLKKLRAMDFENDDFLKQEKVENDKKRKIGFHQPCFLYLVRVLVPCMELYGNYPGFLFRKARQGDVDAISNLLKLDKGVIQDSRIGHHIHRISLNAESDEFRKISRAFSSTTLVTSVSKYKSMVAARISRELKERGENVTAPEIQMLFDVISNYRNPDTMIDSDLPESPEAFAKTIQRKAPLYSPLFKPDKK